MTPKSFDQMQPSERRRAVLGVVAWMVMVWIVFVGAYFIFSVGHDSSTSSILKLIIDLALVAGVIAWQLRPSAPWSPFR